MRKPRLGRRMREGAVVLAAGLVGFAVFASADLAERFMVFAGRHEAWQLDEAIGAVLFAALALAVVLWLGNRRERSYLRRIEESEQRFETIFQGTADMLLVSDAGGRILDANEEAVRALGYSRGELVGAPLLEAGVSFGPEKTPDLWQRLVGGERVVASGVTRRKDGREFRAEASASLVEIEGERAVIATIRDVTEREEALEALRVSRERGEAILRAVPDVACRITLDGVYLDVRAGEKRPLLRPLEQVLGNNVRNVLGEETGGALLAKVREAVRTGGVESLEYPLQTEDGEKMIEARVVYVGGMRRSTSPET